jgi:hypothetical protein
MRPTRTTPEQLIAALVPWLAHHTSRFNLLPGAPNDFIDYHAAIRVQCYDSP